MVVYTDKIRQVISLLVCLMIVASLAIVKQGKLWGHDFKQQNKQTQVADNDTLRTLADGTVIVNTSALGADITGYAGKVPLEIYIKDNIVVEVKAMKNDETESFFDEAAVLLNQWKGKEIGDAAKMKVDAVSGATFSSNAIIGNMQRGLQYAYEKIKVNDNVKNDGNGTYGFNPTFKNIGGLLVALMAAVLPIFIKNKRYRFVQMLLNIVVLGFWCGTFLSYSSLMGFAANGINLPAMAIATIMIITAFVYPLFGKKTYYCSNMCPFGALQQLAGQCFKFKIKINARTLHRLDIVRQMLWAALMVCIWSGVWSEWIESEPFSAFIFQSASWITMTLAGAFFLLSFFVTRPYCRFVCPMGTLLKLSQTSKQ